MKEIFSLIAATAAYAFAGLRIVQTELTMDVLTFGLIAAASILVSVTVTSPNKNAGIGFWTKTLVVVSTLGFIASIPFALGAALALFTFLMGADLSLTAVLYAGTSVALFAPVFIMVRNGTA